MKTKKTVSEWLGEVKIYDDRISQLYKKINNNKLYTLVSNLQYNVRKDEYDKRAEQGKAMLQELAQITRNRLRIREAIRAFNAVTDIKVGDTTYKIATCLEIANNEFKYFIEEPILEKQIGKIISDREELDYNRDEALDKLKDKSAGSQSSAKKDDILTERTRQDYQEVFIDKIGIEDRYNNLAKERLTFKTMVQVALNKVNALSELEIDLDEK